MIGFLLESCLLGAGLAMDAFTVSIADGLSAPDMKTWQRGRIAFTFAFFQFLMPLLGWLCVSFIVQIFGWLEKAVPWIGFGLLMYLGIKMILEGILEHKTQKEEGDDSEPAKEQAPLSTMDLLMQGVATSIDALSVGFAISAYSLPQAAVAALIIGMVTFVICLIGLFIGRSVGMHLASKATIAGGLILMGIGISLLF